MGYACPVCSDPQADAGHLANHLAFTAMLGDTDHEAWLDDRAPAWAEMGESELADVVAERVEETEFPQLFEDTAGGLEDGPNDPPEERSGALFDDIDAGHGHGGGGHAGHDHGGYGHSHTERGSESDHASARGGVVDTSGPVDGETAEVLEEAREMTRRMYGADGNDDGNTDSGNDDGNTDSGNDDGNTDNGNSSGNSNGDDAGR
ncbi:DUF5810 domain-containing protein [Natronomonas sp. LN261]|jgi:hypothetical protein|uniref:DUF5810 domain-containing protein n=1 Tax=Natronomonas sp. LN261 TaxID=2750669 RepID=UPI0015EE798C|nr:DUF5810 domain-containing protein [Natronomonas sp. LN261]